MIKFTVLDSHTGKIADPEQIARTEKWAKDLMYIDMEGFAIQEDGSLILMDECGKFVYCPDNRFSIIINNGNLTSRS